MSAKKGEGFFVVAHKPFNLYKRSTTKNNRFIYYVQFYDEDENRLGAQSTGQTSKAAAEEWAYAQLQKEIIVTEKKITFGQYAKDWWIWDRCRYVDLMHSYLDQPPFCYVVFCQTLFIGTVYKN